MEQLCAQSAQHLPDLEAEGAQSHEHKSLWHFFFFLGLESFPGDIDVAVELEPVKLKLKFCTACKEIPALSSFTTMLWFGI